LQQAIPEILAMSSRKILSRLILASFSVAAPIGAQAGDPDPTFGHAGQILIDFNLSTDLARDVALQPDGKIVVVGETYVNNDFSEEDFAVSRHLPNGTLDTSFGNGGKVKTDFPGLAAVASSVVVQPDGKIVVAGGAFPIFTFLGDIAVVRYNPDGSLDTSFGNGGIVGTSFPGQGSYAFDVALLPDGKIVVAGTHFINFQPSEQTSDTNFAIVRYNPDGSLDPTFGNNGGVSTDFDNNNDDAFSILVQPDGKLVAVGSALNLANFYDFAAARYNTNGSLDASFGTGGKVRLDFGNHDFDRAHAAALQADGKIVAAGFAVSDGGSSQPFALARWNANGTLDGSFDGDGKAEIDFGSFFQAAWEVSVQPDGKIVTAGYPNSESSDSDFLIARCLPDGSLDPTFGTGGKVRTSFGDLNGGAEGAALQPDGRVVAVGWQATFSEVSNQWSQFALARYRGDAAWADQGLPLPGTLGAPVLSGTGDLSPSTSASIELVNALPNALAGLFAAAASSPVPFKGGVLQANPFLGPFFTSTGPAGAITLNFTVPASLPSGAKLWLQWAIKDPGAVQGVALSNAITGFVP
jgi:uncharacterized delta-60 repeat protein